MAGRSSDASGADDAQEDEFDTLPLWTADAVLHLGPQYAVPAACRGSGTPAALRWLAASMGLSAGHRLVDAGAGEGGPAELVARELAARPVLVDPMPGACLAARRLFGRPTAVAGGDRLPFADDTFDAGWSLGVLCTLDRPSRTSTLRELSRVVRPGGAVGLLVFVRTVERLPEVPEGNDFPSDDEVASLLGEAGLEPTHRASLHAFPDPPVEWRDRAATAERAVADAHAGDPRLVAAQEQQRVFGRLLGDGSVHGRLLAARVR